MKILVVDDSKTTQMLVMQALHRLPDAEFLSAANGREALTIVAGTHLDLLVTDVNMPEMDGIALVHEVRKIRSPHDLPIVLVTARADERAMGEGMSAGADACVLKPLSRQELVDTAERLLERRTGDVAQEDPAR